ncbi:hypothetical protein C8F01DRAFT_232321 [Mycena amicta]|nr:hypothetical protein C8F01DRAFT_232321 [Mycena amicta]
MTTVDLSTASMVFPTEVAELVIDACPDRTSLASCSLVSRAWHNRAAFRLFARPIKVVGVPDLDAFMATIRHPLCTIRFLICTLSIKQAASNPSLFNHIIPDLVQLSNITSLELIGNALLSDQALALFRSGFRSLRHLSLRIAFPTSVDALTLVCSFPLLESLHLQARWVGSLSPPRSTLPPTLHTLALDGFLDDALAWLLSCPPPPTLSSLQFHDVANRESGPVIDYFRHVAATVTVFKLSFIDSRAETRFTELNFGPIIHVPCLHTLEIRGHYSNGPHMMTYMLARIVAPNLELVSLNSLLTDHTAPFAWLQLGQQLLQYAHLRKLTVETPKHHQKSIEMVLRDLEERKMLEFSLPTELLIQ